MQGLSTERLILRRWKADDLEPFAQICADPSVMEFYPKPLTFQEARAAVERIEAQFEADDFGLWALEVQKTGEFIGYVGLSRPSFHTHFTPCVEIGWRLARKHWGSGLATEAAREALQDGFERIHLKEIVSFTALINKRSIKLMERIGMIRNPEDDFLHPSLADGDRLKPHVLFRLSRTHWCQSNNKAMV